MEDIVSETAISEIIPGAMVEKLSLGGPKMTVSLHSMAE